MGLSGHLGRAAAALPAGIVALVWMSDRESADPDAAATFERESKDAGAGGDIRELNYEEGPLAKGNDKCTDCSCLVAFVLFWMGNFVVFSVAYSYGDAERLFYATDYQGNTCGQGAFADLPLGFYPRLPEDALAALQSAQTCAQDVQTGELGSCDTSLYTVCVASCPVAGQIVCNYDMQGSSEAAKELAVALRNGCWRNPIETQEVMKRCVPALDQYKSSTLYECDGVPLPTPTVPSKDYCMGLLTEVITTEFNTTAGADTLMRNLVSTSNLVNEYFGDVITALPTILGFGLGLSIASAFTYVFIMQYVAGCVVWAVVFLLFLVWAAITTALMVKGGVFFGIDISPYTAAAINATDIGGLLPETAGMLPAGGSVVAGGDSGLAGGISSSLGDR